MFFPDQLFHGVQGHLGPWDVRFDPDDAAHLSVDGTGRVRFRLVTEPAFASAHLVLADGGGVPLDLVGTSRRLQVWEGTYDAGGPFRYTFALETLDGRAVYRVPAGIGNAVERLDRWHCDPAAPAAPSVPDWARGAVIYQIFPERFHSGDPSLTPDGAVPWGAEPHWLEFQGGDLLGIAGRAAYLESIGVDVVYLNPIFTSPSTHRYDAVDFYSVDPALGGNAALAALVEALHARGIRLIVDASFNHCHPRFFAFADVVERGPGSEYWSWFDVRGWPVSAVVRPHVLGSQGWQAGVEDYLEYLRRFSEESGIPVVADDGDGPPLEVNYDAWYGVPTLPRIDLTDPGARAYFLDVARFWVREYGIDGWRMDVARYVDFDFWPEFRRAVRSERSDAYLLAEIMGDASRWLQGDTFDATMNYTFRQLCLDFFATGRIDGTGLADGLLRMYAAYSPEANEANQNLIGSHDTARFLHEADGRREALRLATVLQMTVPGAPGLYYGDEVGMSGGEEPASRGAFPWEESVWDDGQLAAVRELGALRRRHPVLRHGGFRTVTSGRDALAYLRTDASDSLLIAVNRGASTARLEAVVPGDDPAVVWGAGGVVRTGDRVEVTVPAASAVIALL
jgi:neopullulanase